MTVISYNTFSQNVVDGQVITNKSDITSNTILKHCADQIGIDLDQYQIVTLSKLVSIVKEQKSSDINFKTVSNTFEYSTINNCTQQKKIKEYNGKTKRYPNNRYLYCDYTLNKNSNYEVLFYIVE
jgi:hypothetical protein